MIFRIVPMSILSFYRVRVHCGTAKGFALQPQRTMFLFKMPSPSDDAKDLPGVRCEEGRNRIQ